jgi:hypothetical protein
MDVHIDLARIEILVIVRNLVAQNYVNAIVDVHANDEGNFQLIIGPNSLLFLMEYVDLALGIDDRGLISLGRGHRDRSTDGVNVVMLELIGRSGFLRA